MFTNLFPEYIQEKYPDLGALESVSTIGGGDINEAFKLQFKTQTLFVKKNSEQDYPGMFEKEARALEHLDAKTSFTIPKVVDTGALNGESYLLLKFVEPAPKEPDFWEQFGAKLAEMHQCSREQYGLDYDNYMGKLEQGNRPQDSWPEFFATQRIEPQMKMAREGGYFDSGINRRIERLLTRVEELVPKEQPALVHGDLWGGNYMVDATGGPALIDPAMYYGHREIDIAMMHLFGGFDKSLFTAYNQHFPLESGWQERLDLHNLYPVLVHVNLFGGGYADQAKSIISRFS